MNKHRPPTSVTIAQAGEKSGIQEWLEKYWKLAAAVALVVAAVIVYRERAHSSRRTEAQTNWSRVLAATQEDRTSGTLSGAVDDLRAVESSLRGTQTGAWALYIAATSAITAKDYTLASSLLDELTSRYPQHALLKVSVAGSGEDGKKSLVEQIRARISSQEAFIREHPSLFENPPLPESAPRVRISTDRGSFLVGLYKELAPSHVENFLKLARDGYYVGTKFHSILKDQYIQGGDPNTRDGEAPTWGQGGPEYTLDLEDTGLKHFPGILSAVPAPAQAGKTSGSQFLVTVGAVHGLDGTHVPFGRVLDGMDLLKELAGAPLADGTINRPANPVVIQATEVVE